MHSVMLRFALILIATSCLTALGQCDADFDFDGAPWGVSPDPALGESFETGALNSPYEDVLHLKVPLNLSALDENIDLELDSVEVVQDFINLDGTYYGVVFVDTATQEQFFANELGLTVTFNNNGSSPVPYIVLPDAQFCAAIEGVPTRAGFYRVKLDIAVWLNPFGEPFTQLFTFDNFRLNVLDASLGCTDMNACNYNPQATQDDDSCSFITDECGVCGIPAGFCDCNGNQLDAIGICGGNCAEDADADGICDENLLCGPASLSTLTVEITEDVSEGLDLYRLYVDLPPNPNWYVSAVAGDQNASPLNPLRVTTLFSAPEGVFNTPLNSSWNAVGLSTAFIGVFPELAFDSYATIGLAGPASESIVANAIDPNFTADSQTTSDFLNFFNNSGQTHLEVEDGAWYITASHAEQGMGDGNGRCLIGRFVRRGQFKVK